MDNIPEEIMKIQSSYCQAVPSVRDAHKFIEDLILFLFPIKDNQRPGIKETRLKYTQLEIELEELLKPVASSLKGSPEELSEIFLILFILSIWISWKKPKDIFNTIRHRTTLKRYSCATRGFML